MATDIDVRAHAEKLAALVLELAEAVDNAASDIGGSRSQLDILREAVVVAVCIVDRVPVMTGGNHA